MMSKRVWLVFATTQTIGFILASYGTVYSDLPFARGSWLVGLLLLLPGTPPALAVSETLNSIRTAYIFFPVAIVTNAMVWIMCSGLWQKHRHTTPKGNSHCYSVSLTATGLVFVIANMIHFMRPVTCTECIFPYGLPFTVYHEGVYAGGAGFVWGGLAADVGFVVVVGLVIGFICKRTTRPQLSG